MITAACAWMCALTNRKVKCDVCIYGAFVFYLTNVVVDIKASVSELQELDQLVDNGQLPLHHSYMKSSAMNKTKP